MNTLLNCISLCKEHIVKITSGMKLRLGLHKMTCGQRILNLVRLRTDHLVKLVQMASEFVGNTTSLVNIAGINKLLEVLDLVLVTEETE